jgi:hypothetical protein
MMLDCHILKHLFAKKFRVFWDILPGSQIDVDRRFRGACCLHHQGDES